MYRPSATLLCQLDQIAAGDPVPDRERCDRSFKAGTEGAARDLAWELCPRVLSAARTTDSLGTVLCDVDRDDRQLLDLMAPRITDRHMLSLSEHVTAGAALWPVLDHVIHRPRRQQRSSLALMAGLCAPWSSRGVPAAGRSAWPICARRL
jgi:hypothetical protein